jgi:tRNA threonylcarbamoyl adenosine modification protein YeaZ
VTGRLLLAIDTATTRIVVATGSEDGALLDAADWPAGYRHGETLLPAVERLLAAGGLGRDEIGAVIVGTGPGTFTGLRVGLATAKGIAHGLGRPIVGIPTGTALIEAAAADLAIEPARIRLLLPAGPSDRILVRDGAGPVLLPAGEEPADAASTVLVAVDLAGRAADDANERGERARAGLAATLVRLGAATLRDGGADDLARLVPEYVTLPRGAAPAGGEVTWSHDPR